MVNKLKNKHEILNIALLCFYLSFVMVLGLFIVYLDRDNKNPGNIILGIFGLFIGFCLLVGLQIFWHRKKFSRGYYLIHPPFQINIWIIFFWVVPAIFSVINPDFLRSRNLFFFVDFRYYVNGLYLVLIGCLVIWLSYTVSSRFIRPLSFIRQFSSKEIKLRYLLVVYLISMIFELFQISVSGIAFSADRLAFGRFISLYQWISYIIDLKYLVLVIVAFKVFQKQIPPYYLLLLVFVQVLSSFSSVFIKPFFSLSLLIIISYVIAKRSYKKVLYFAIITLFILVLVIPIIGNLRDQINLKRIDPKDITQVVSATLYAVKNTWFTSISFSWDIFLEVNNP